MNEHEVKIVVKQAVQETLVSIGIDVSTPDAILRTQETMAWAHGRRELEERISLKVILVAVTAATGAVLGLLALGFRQMFNTH